MDGQWDDGHTEPGRRLEMDDYMNNDQYNVFLENIAKLIEANAKTVEEAAQIVRDSKVQK